MQPQRLSILGVGLLGGSIGLAIKNRLSSCKVIGYGHRVQGINAALAAGAIDEGYERPEQAVRGADLVILCTPVAMLSPLLEQIASEIPDGAIVTDVGSTKRQVVAAAQRLLRPAVHFVGSHPMAGSERRGVQFARADLFEGAACITTPTHQTHESALAGVEAFWQMLGMRITRLSPERHDQLLADVSHLPHAIAAALMSMQQDEALALCGKGFLDLTRIASGDGALWRDILLDNRDNVRQSIRRLMNELERLDGLMEPSQAEALRHWLDTAAARRQALLESKGG